MGAPREVARVRREALSACLTCPLCRGLVREATAIAECLHTFCRGCIMKEINDEDVDRCPVCNIDLGCDPEEKLRPDHNLQDIRNKLFPLKRERVASSKGAILPAKRKQRSLSSLVVETPRVEIKAGVTGKRTSTRRRTASRAMSPVRNGTMNIPNKSESRDQATEKHTAPQSTKVVTTANKKQAAEKHTTPQSSKVITAGNKKPATEKNIAPQSTKVVTTSNKKQRTTDVDGPKKPSSEDKKSEKTTDKEELRKPLNSFADAASRAKLPRSSPKTRAVKEQIIKNKEVELPIRKQDTENEVVSSGTRVQTHSNKSRFHEENKGTSSEPAPLKEKTTTEDKLKQDSLGTAGKNALNGAATTPVWFSLVALHHQKEDPQLPQLSKNYLRIKDRSLKISSLQRYIMTKLDLANADEVEITCQGEPISPSSTMQGLVDLWVRREAGGLVHALLDAPAKECVMVLGYRRRQRAPAP